MGREVRGFALVHQKFQRKSMEKLSAWISLNFAIANFLGYHRNSQYQKEFDELMENFCQIGASMSVKMHCLRSYLDYFLENCGDFNEEQGKHFDQDISDMEKHYQGGWDINFLANYCW